MSTWRTDPGKIRGISRILSPDGFFLMSAIDHLGDFTKLLQPDGTDTSFEHVVRAKERIARVLAQESSAVLLDPEYGLGHIAPTDAIPATVGVVASIEGDDYEVRHAERTTTFRDSWSAAKAKRAGADAAKLLWYYRPDGNQAIRDSQLDMLRAFLDECDSHSLPSIVEPIWNPLPGEDTKSPVWRRRRSKGIVQSAIEVDQLGADILKVEFPGDVDSETTRTAAVAACKELHESVTAPWVILSAGVTFDEFSVQLEIAAAAGASGYLAGRSLWREAASASTPADFAAGIELTRARMRSLNETTRRAGHPVTAAQPIGSLLKAIPHGWYRAWADDTASVTTT